MDSGRPGGGGKRVGFGGRVGFCVGGKQNATRSLGETLEENVAGRL